MVPEPFGQHMPKVNQGIRVWKRLLFSSVAHTQTALERSDSRRVLCRGEQMAPGQSPELAQRVPGWLGGGGRRDRREDDLLRGWH